MTGVQRQRSVVGPPLRIDGGDRAGRCESTTGGLAAASNVVDEFTEAWERGEKPLVETFLDRLDPADSEAAVELIYRDYFLTERGGCIPDPAAYFARFPMYRESLERVLQVHDVWSSSLLCNLVGPPRAELPEAGDTIAPFELRRELGRGSFARVFLAAQTDLSNRLVVVKVSSQTSREPWLLARAQHTHIVEIVSHALVDDGALQVICMPFFGGATMADVLAARPKPGSVPISGRELLADLDGVSAPEYPIAHSPRPARELLARLSYSQALAWVVARLAEALDYAFSRGVAHGDVKPSNILLSADGNPMLLDFNLARDGAPTDCTDELAWPIDPGGTLAYMAPERLRELAAPQRAGDLQSGLLAQVLSQESEAALDLRLGRSLTELAPHRADLYSLGMVLLEGLTASSATVVPAAPAADRAPRPARFRAAARVLTAARERSPQAMIRESETAGGRTVAPGLRAILERCLDPVPARRYRRGLELAEDLDRWRVNRRLAFADEPFWGQTVPRWLRRQRRMLSVAALSVTVALVTMTIVWQGSNRTLHRNLEQLALDKLARHWDDPVVRTYGEQRPHRLEFLIERDEPEVVEAAHHALSDYDVLAPAERAGFSDWRSCDAVRYLPDADRDDLELWILGQAYRYCRALEDRPESPGDWERALNLLDRASGSLLIPAFDPLRQRLMARVMALRPYAPPVSAGRAVPAWVDEHLRGYVAEFEPVPREIVNPPRLGSSDVAAVLEGQTRTRRGAAERALSHYEMSLTLHPGSFWGHFQAAGASFALGRVAESAGHLEQCLRRRPRSSVLRGQLAGCLAALRRYPEALRECEEALRGSPDHAEFYRTRAFIRAKLGQSSGLEEDIQHFELLSRILPRAFWSRARGEFFLGTRSEDERSFPAALGVQARLDHRASGYDGEDTIRQIDPNEIDARVVVAAAIYDAGAIELATSELAKVLKLDPDHLAARWRRVVQAIEAGKFDEVRGDLDTVLSHPDLVEYIREEPRRLLRLYKMTRTYLRGGNLREARTVARRALDLAIVLKIPRGEAHYYLARACAIEGRSNPEAIGEAAKQFYCAFTAHPIFRQWYQVETDFDPVRIPIDMALRQLERAASAASRPTSSSTARDWSGSQILTGSR
jgi:serine/threonine protein kinase/tetratricopeptide (TPR) repeat protein